MIFVPFNTPSLKNSKVKTSKGIFHSKTVKKYLQALGVKEYNVREGTYENYKTRPNLFLKTVEPIRSIVVKKEPPLILGFHFYRKTRHKFDFVNAVQIICDLLTAHGIIEDDNMDYLVPVPFKIDGRWYHHKKDNPGCWLKIMGKKELKC